MPDSDGGVYRDLSVEMRDGLKNIYQQISNVSAAGSGVGDPKALFNDASDQLREVVRETESAAMDIMDIVEKHLQRTERSASLLLAFQKKYGDSQELEELRSNNNSLAQDLTTVLSALSFQDITGQRIKKVMAALGNLEKSVVDLYLSSGLIIEAADKDPAKTGDVIKADAKKAIAEYRESRIAGSELKGPDKNGVSQAAIDDMLAQLGL